MTICNSPTLQDSKMNVVTVDMIPSRSYSTAMIVNILSAARSCPTQVHGPVKSNGSLLSVCVFVSSPGCANRVPFNGF